MANTQTSPPALGEVGVDLSTNTIKKADTSKSGSSLPGSSDPLPCFLRGSCANYVKSSRRYLLLDVVVTVPRFFNEVNDGLNFYLIILTLFQLRNVFFLLL